jgi:transcriptional regulator with XRE-family HTH domain
MQIEEIKQRKEQFKEFGEILVRRHGQNYCSSYHNQCRVTIDEAAIRFGRYLHAARLNQGLSIEELAAQAKLSEATQIALEQGIILACDIKPKWLKELARTLDEDIEDFNLMLGRKIVGAGRWSKLAKLWQSQPWFTKMQTLAQQRQAFSPSLLVGLLSKPVYAACSMLLLCMAITSTILLWTPSASDQLASPSEAKQTVITTKPTARPIRRFSMERTEYDFETQALASPPAVGSRWSCCIY